MDIKDVVIVIPVHKQKISNDEIDSLEQLLKILGHYQICFVCPQGLDLCRYETFFEKYQKKFTKVCFEDKYFKSYIGYNKLCLSKNFYKKFENYKYMLIYQLDAWVFKDELLEWCDKDFDYIGAPINPNIFQKLSLGNINAGCGGFSLRKIGSMLKLAEFNIENKKLNNYKSFSAICEYFKKKRFISNLINIPISVFVYIFQYFYNFQYMHNEDLIIAYYSQKFLPDFKIAKNEVSEKFALEYNTFDKFYSETFILPFGCHNPRYYKFLIYKHATRGILL